MNFVSRSKGEYDKAHEEEEEEEIVLLSNQDFQVFQIVNHVVLGWPVCFLGIIGNIVNIIVFLKQGLNNTVKISMFAISVSDVCGLVTFEWVNINLNPFMENADVPFEPSEIQFLTGGLPHACFSKITLWITVYVTVERFVCITVPLKVKLIFTAFRTKVFIITIYLFMFLTLAPEYIVYYFGEHFYPFRNETRIGIKERKNLQHVNGIISVLYAVIGIVSLAALVLFTCLLVLRMQRRLQWRTRSTNNEDASAAMSKRDRKSMKMVCALAVTIVISVTPSLCLSWAAFCVPGFVVTGRYRTIVHVTWCAAFLAEAVNSSVNIVLFYKMSSQFRNTIRESFCPHWKNGSG